MDVIEKLIKALEEAKAELTKDDMVRPDKGYGKVIIKNPPAPKPKDPTKPFGRVILKDEDQKVNLDNPYNDQDDDKKKLKKEELSCSANGQWNILQKDAVNPKLAPKDVKVKQLKAQIDAGTYKPDPKKIADAMLKEEEPHKDDPKHEEKEEKKAEVIKDKAQELLDMHKK